MKYQICIIKETTNDKGKKETTVTATHIINADNLVTAYETATATFTTDTLRIYPYATMTDGNSITDLAKHTVKSYEKWETRNAFAVLNPINRTETDREDMISTACLAIVSALAENANTDSFTLYSIAIDTIRKEQAGLERKNEREYHPDWKQDTVKPLIIRSTCPQLDRLVRQAIKTADLTKGQLATLEKAYKDRMGAQEIADEEGKSRQAIYNTLYKAQRKILDRMAEIDTNLHTLKKAGFTAEDIETAQATLRKRTKK